MLFGETKYKLILQTLNVLKYTFKPVALKLAVICWFVLCIEFIAVMLYWMLTNGEVMCILFVPCLSVN